MASFNHPGAFAHPATFAPYGQQFVHEAAPVAAFGAAPQQTFVGAQAFHPGFAPQAGPIPNTHPAFFYPSSPKPPVYTLPRATNYKNWRQTEVELGRFNQTMAAYARQNGLM